MTTTTTTGNAGGGARRPNILLVHSDQHRWDSLGCNGHPQVQTPNLDRLAREGANFSHAFTPIAICTPARACLMTGAWPTTHKNHGIPTMECIRPASQDLPVLTSLLNDAGYHIDWVGKFHREVFGGPTDYGVASYAHAGQYREFRQSKNIPSTPRKHGLFGEVDEDCPADCTHLAWQADQIIARMDEAVERGGDDPFFLRWDPPEPHLPCKPPRQFADLYPPETIEPWISWPDTQENKPDAQKRQKKIWGLEEWGWDKWQPIVSCYYAVITELDFHLGRILDRLEHHGLQNDTIVIYSTDHGDYCGGHGQIDKHFAMYDDLYRVPLLVRWPGHVPAGQVCDAFAYNEIDVAKTLLEIAGLEVPETFVGHNLIKKINGEGPERDYVGGQYFGTESGLQSLRMLRDRRYKYVYNPTSLCEFYDLEADPGELRNLIDDPAVQPEITRLKQHLWDWMKSVGDPLANRWTAVELLGEPSQSRQVGL